jgi:ATP-dependent DNA helicase RecG
VRQSRSPAARDMQSPTQGIAPATPKRVAAPAARSKLQAPCILTWDLETTGLDPLKHRVTDIAVFECSGGRSWSSLVNPGRVPYPKDVQAITGIYLEMVSEPHVPGFAVAAELFEQKVEEFAAAHGQNVLLVAHNARSFDVRFLQEEYARCGRTIPSHWRFVDSLEIALRHIAKDGVGTWRLASLVDRFNVEKLTAHRALPDAIMLAAVLDKMVSTFSVSLLDFSFQATAGARSKGARPPPPPDPVVQAVDIDDELSDDVDDVEGEKASFSARRSSPAPAHPPPPPRYSDPAAAAEAQVHESLAPDPAIDGLHPLWKECLSYFVADGALRPDDMRLLKRLDDVYGMEAFTRLYPTNFQQNTPWSPELVAKSNDKDKRKESVHVVVKGIIKKVHFPKIAKTGFCQLQIDVDTALGPCTCVMFRRSETYIRSVASRLGGRLDRPFMFRGTIGWHGPKQVVMVNSEGEEDAGGEEDDTEDSDGVEPTVEIIPTWPAVVDASGERHNLQPPRRKRILLAALDAAERAERERGDWVLAAMSAEEVQQMGLLSGADALRRLHQPVSLDDLQQARKRLAFEELLVLQLAVRSRRRKLLADTLAEACSKNSLVEMARKSLAERDFILTEAQHRVLTEVLADMARTTPMVRLVIGDTGCGKSVVAFLALLAAADAGVQAALMAPTQILAQQHVDNLNKLLARLPPGQQPRVKLVTNAKESAAELKSGAIQIAVGTHALIQEDAEFKHLGLVVIDEEHRFGVDQRNVLLRRDSQRTPHVMTMSSTPIPRSLALCMYGEHNMSFINGKPAHVAPPVITEQRVYDAADAVRRAVLEEVRSEVARGGRVFLVYHKVQAPEAGSSGGAAMRAAISAHAELSAPGGLLAGISVGLIHGKLKEEEKAAAMSAFKAGTTPVLVASKVVEVGVDVPEATLLVVEDADCFGLAELHQLRGRVGRGHKQGRCILLFDETREKAKERMAILCRTADGIDIAEADLRMRGFGELLDSTQTGATKVLQLADPLRDVSLGDKAREVAARLTLLKEGTPLALALHYALKSRGQFLDDSEMQRSD